MNWGALRVHWGCIRNAIEMHLECIESILGCIENALRVHWECIRDAKETNWRCITDALRMLYWQCIKDTFSSTAKVFGSAFIL